MIILCIKESKEREYRKEISDIVQILPPVNTPQWGFPKIDIVFEY